VVDSVAASVKLTILPEGSEKGFVVDTAVGTLAFGTVAGFEEIVSSHQGLPAELEKLKEEVGSQLTLDWPTANKAIGRLYTVGRQFLRQFLGDDFHEVPRLRSLIEAALRPLLDQGATPLVQVTSPRGGLLSMIVPVEIFPLLMRQPPPEVSSFPQFTAALEGILGFSTIITRHGPRVPSSEPLRRTRGLPIKLFQHTRLAHVPTEMEFFTTRPEKFDYEGPWPDQMTEQQNMAVRTIAEHLAYPQRRFNGSDRNLPDQIQHFACHCDTFAPHQNDHSFSLYAEDAGELEITLGELLSEQLLIADNPNAPPRCIMPLVFFNACGTAVFELRGAASFVKFFMQNGNRGFIGTQTPIPDAFAGTFCEIFYANLLRGAEVGSALLEARKNMSKRYRNPLGILYVYYGPPGLRVD
jgi:CHAT domain